MERIVFLDRQSLKAEVRKPGFAHHWEEHAQTLEQSVVDRLSEATVAITNKVPIRLLSSSCRI
jgi:glycerate dehydrogenase